MAEFSVLMSVYRNDAPEALRLAVESVTIRQSVNPAEVILVVDGPVPDALRDEILALKKEIPTLRPLWQEKNQGLGIALQIGMQACSHEIVARMDSDDISLSDRFEKQLAYLNAHPEIAIVGGQIEEFIGEPSNVVGRRQVPCNDNEVKAMMKSRCALNHMTVMMRRSKILETGNYQPWHFNEDYYLWIRLMEKGYAMGNLPDVLVSARVGAEMYKRRGGWNYFKSEKGLQDYMFNRKLIGAGRYGYNVLGRFVIQVAMPNWLRGFVFQKLFRK